MSGYTVKDAPEAQCPPNVSKLSRGGDNHVAGARGELANPTIQAAAVGSNLWLGRSV